MKRLDCITDSTDMSLRKLQETVKFREAWGATVHGVRKSQTQLSDRTAAAKKKKGNPLLMHNMGGSQNHHAKSKKSDPKDYSMTIHYMTFWKRQSYEDRKWKVVAES